MAKSILFRIQENTWQYMNYREKNPSFKKECIRVLENPDKWTCNISCYAINK